MPCRTTQNIDGDGGWHRRSGQGFDQVIVFDRRGQLIESSSPAVSDEEIRHMHAYDFILVLFSFVYAAAITHILSTAGAW